MPITVTEHQDSQSYTENQSATLVYMIEGTSSTISATAALKSEAPTTFAGLTRKIVKVEPQYVNINDDDNSIWRGTVTYGKATTLTLPSTGDEKLEFDFGGGTKRVTQAISQTTYDSSGADATDRYKGAIGVTPDGVEGIDIDYTTGAFAITKIIPKDDVDATFTTNVLNTVNTVNNATFRGGDAGSVRLTKATASEYDDANYSFRFAFLFNKNETNLVVGDITVASKGGHEALWVQYEETEDTTKNMTVRTPQTASVAKVYPDGDFSVLGITT